MSKKDMIRSKETEATMRFTIDVSRELHRRIKTSCASRDTKMADEIRQLLEQNYPQLTVKPNKGKP